MAKVISFINLKGGVGKTTLTVNIAATLAKSHGKKVLVIDLDPQTNATVSLITQQEWKERHDVAKQTLYHMFNDVLEDTNDFDIDEAIIKGVGGITQLDLLPSSMQLVEIQDLLPAMGNKSFISHVDVLGNHIDAVKKQYDYILIDCPPNLGAITLNGINISDCYIIPTVPDILSRIGIDLILSRIENFQQKKPKCHIKHAGIIFSKVNNRSNLHKTTMMELREGKLKSHIFEHVLPERISIAEAPIDSKPYITSPNARKKKDWHDIKTLISLVTEEFIYKIN